MFALDCHTFFECLRIFYRQPRIISSALVINFLNSLSIISVNPSLFIFVHPHFIFSFPFSSIALSFIHVHVYSYFIIPLKFHFLILIFETIS